MSCKNNRVIKIPMLFVSYLVILLYDNINSEY